MVASNCAPLCQSFQKSKRKDRIKYRFEKKMKELLHLLSVRTGNSDSFFIKHKKSKERKKTVSVKVGNER